MLEDNISGLTVLDSEALVAEVPTRRYQMILCQLFPFSLVVEGVRDLHV